jgi:anti-sigma factor RsiW
MNINRDGVKDLLAVYLAGEASADTRALVEDWLKTDRELARQVEHARRSSLPPVSPPAPTSEKRALDRTRRRLRLRIVLLGVAVYVTTLPVSVTFNRSGFSGLLIDNWPERIVVTTLALVLWGFYWHMSRQMRVAGL